MREEGVDFQQCSNAFLRCNRPERLQELADTLTAEDLSSCGQKWLTRFTPFFTETERRQAGCRHRLFFSQIEFCDNLIFRRRAALDKLGERLLDANRNIGRPNKITVIFGRKVTKQYRGKLQTEIEDMNLPNPVIRSHYRNGFIKQYVRDHLILRTEAAGNNVTDYGVNKAVEHLPALRDKLSAINNNYLNIQQDILETFVDRGQLQRLTKSTITATGKRIPGLKLDNPRQLALMHALVRFAQIPPANTFSTGEILPHVIAALGPAAERYSLASLRYDLSKLRAKGLVERLPRSRRYRLPAKGYSVCLIFLKLFDRVYAPLTAALLHPIAADQALTNGKRSPLDRLYQRLTDTLDHLLRALGLAFSPPLNENKILVDAPITAKLPHRRVPSRRVELHRTGELAEFEPPHISAYRSDLQATAAKLTVQQLCFVAPYRNLARPIREKPRMMPRIAITQIAKMIGRELESDAGPSEEALAAGAMLAEAGAPTEIVGRLLAEAHRKRPNERMVHAYAFMLEAALRTLRL